MYRAEAITPQELKHGSPRSDPNVTPDVDELKTNYLLDGDQVQSLNALSKYQATTKSWGDRVVIPQIVQRRRLVLTRTTIIESKGKFEPKW
jgi:hypothetical protein